MLENEEYVLQRADARRPLAVVGNFFFVLLPVILITYLVDFLGFTKFKLGVGYSSKFKSKALDNSFQYILKEDTHITLFFFFAFCLVLGIIFTIIAKILSSRKHFIITNKRIIFKLKGKSQEFLISEVSSVKSVKYDIEINHGVDKIVLPSISDAKAVALIADWHVAKARVTPQPN